MTGWKKAPLRKIGKRSQYKTIDRTHIRFQTIDRVVKRGCLVFNILTENAGASEKKINSF